MTAWWLVLSAYAADPRCKGRVSDKDRELTLEITLEADDGMQRGIEFRTGTGPDASRATVQTRLRSRLEALVACYEPRVGADGGPDLTVRVALDVVEGRPAHVAVDTPPEEAEITTCLEQVVRETPMPCKLDAQGFVFPMRLYTVRPPDAVDGLLGSEIPGGE